MPKSSLQNIEHRDFKLPEIFRNLKPNIHLLHLSVLRQLTNKRAFTASTKTRSEVRGGGRKPWRQKGTGRARTGSIRSPLWVGGGVSFGPKPRVCKVDLPKKARNLAIAHALVVKEKDIIQINKLPELSGFKTKEFVSFLKSFTNLKYPILLLASEKEKEFTSVRKSSCNVPSVLFLNEKFLGPYEVIGAGNIIITKSAQEGLIERVTKLVKGEK